MCAPETLPPSKASYYCLDLAGLDDKLYKYGVPADKWLDQATTADKNGFAAGSLGKVSPCSFNVQLERCFGIPFYVFLNVVPFLLPLTLMVVGAWRALLLLVVVAVCHAALGKVRGPKKHSIESMARAQYMYTERNSTKYVSTRYVWPRSVAELGDEAVIFAVVPHGTLAPFGVTAYPIWSKLWGGVSHICHWTAAPVVLQLPLVGALLRSLGYLPAKAKAMQKALEKKETVGVILDGVAGMFQQDPKVEKAYINSRKAIVAVAMKAGVPIVPVYGFGHTQLVTLVTDPFGILESLSLKLDTSLAPYYGRWGIPFGPPRREPVLMALGDPVRLPKCEKPTPEQVDEGHKAMLAGFAKVFETHKVAYGWPDKELRFV